LVSVVSTSVSSLDGLILRRLAAVLLLAASDDILGLNDEVLATTPGEVSVGLNDEVLVTTREEVSDTLDVELSDSLSS